MNDIKSKVLADLQDRKLLKVIAGINNYDMDKVLRVVRSAEAMGASVIDISAREDIVIAARRILKNTALMVSSVELSELKRAIELGADMIELGNFEALHDAGIFYSADEVLELAREIMSFKSHALVSITIPGHLEVSEQVQLAEALQEMGVEMIQTEGASLVEAKSASALGQIEKVRLTLANTIEISKVLSHTFIITASGISPDTTKLAIAAGASGVGVGKYVNKLESELEMMAAISALKESLEGAKKLFLASI
jgi:thiamine monophosphate synthase